MNFLKENMLMILYMVMEDIFIPVEIFMKGNLIRTMPKGLVYTFNMRLKLNIKVTG